MTIPEVDALIAAHIPVRLSVGLRPADAPVLMTLLRRTGRIVSTLYIDAGRPQPGRFYASDLHRA